MKRWIAPLCALSLLACEKKEAPPTTTPPAPSGSARPEKAAKGEPAVVTVKHVLIAFQGSLRSQSTRTQEEAQRIAYDVLGKAKQGEDFDRLMGEFSDDKGEKAGTYTLTNEGIAASPDEFDRATMSAAFGDVAFKISVNEIGFADYDPQRGRFGFHIIKRIK